MELWYPPKDRPQLFEWWRPLILASRAARLERVPWPINVDELVLRGRVERTGRPDIWVYSHPESGGELYLDGTGQAYTFMRTPKARGYGRFAMCDIRTAIWRARLPEVVMPIWYEEPPAIPAWLGDAAPAVDPAPITSQGGHAPRRHGHLTVHDGGRPMAG